MTTTIGKSINIDPTAVNAVDINIYYDFEDMTKNVMSSFTEDDVEALEKAGMAPFKVAKIFVTQSGSSKSFISALQEKVLDGKELTVRQVRAVLNIMREDLLGLKRSFEVDPKADTAFEVKCKCPTCYGEYDNFAVMVQHRVDEHGFVPNAGTMEQAIVAPVAVLAEEPETGLDISSIPDGYYAAPLPNSYGTSQMTFLRVKRLRRNRLRNRKYRYGKVISGAEFLPAGTIEVAEMSSNSEKLSGEQRGGQEPGATYKGQFEMHLRIIMADPELWAKMFAKEMGRCGRCGKLLTDDISRSDCFGPECIGKVSDHYYSAWSGKYIEEAKKTCPTPKCGKTDGMPYNEEDTYICSNGHTWYFKVRDKRA